MKIQLSEQFSYKKLLKFTLPSILMMVFTSIYGIVDGFFISNFVGENPFASVNFVMPVLLVLGSFGFMFGSGGSALISKTLGEGNKEEANKLFSLFVYLLLGLGIVLSILGIVFLRPILKLIGASDMIIGDCITYGSVILTVLPLNMLQYAFQTFFPTAEKPTLGFIVTLIAGCTNMVLDALFIIVFKWGVAGAAVATAIAQAVGGIVPLIIFFHSKSLPLKLGKTTLNLKAIWLAGSNGISEFLSNIASSVVGMLYNAQLMKYEQENGVIAYGTLMYVGMIFFAIFMGYSMGVAPIIGFHYGAKNHNEVKNILKRSLVIIGITSACMLASSLLLAKPFSMIFVGKNEELLNLTVRAFYFYSLVFIFAGLNIFSSSFFTALNNGPISALISFLRAAVFQVIAVLTLPLILGTDGIWISIAVADAFATVIAVICLLTNRKKYHY